jgi:hypothetical protein
VYDNVNGAPVLSLNFTVPLMAPVAGMALLVVTTPLVGTVGRTFTVIVWVTLRMPLVAVMVNVSVVVGVAVRRCVVLGV